MKKHILIVEDDAHIRLGLCEALRAEGYDVTDSSSGTEALPLFKQRKPDLVVLDIMLPGKSGYDICREIRATKSRVPILMLSAKGQEVDKVVGLELGADDYVTKPFSLRELLARVQALLRRSDFAAEPAGDMPDEIKFGKVRIETKALRGVRGKEKFELTRQRRLARQNPERSLGHRILRHDAHARSARREAAAENRGRARRAGASAHRPRPRLPAGRIAAIVKVRRQKFHCGTGFAD